jgi:hypothetical protein
MTDENTAANLEALAALAGAIQKTDRKQLARLLVIQKAFKDILSEADAETRAEAKTLFDVGDADSVTLDGHQLGRVRRDKPRQSWRVINWSALETWIQIHYPEAWTPAIAKWALAEIAKTGALVRKATGEILEPPGVALVEGDGNLVVTTTDAAEDLARQLITAQLKELES